MATPTQWLGAFPVNTGQAAGGSQNYQQAIGLSNGNILVIWQEEGDAIGALVGIDIIGKIFDAEGNVVRDSFQLNSLEQISYSIQGATPRDQSDIAPTSDGGFVLTYRSASANGANDSKVHWERFDAGGGVTNAIVAYAAEGDDDVYDPRIAFDQVTGQSTVTFTYREGGLSEAYFINAMAVTSNGVTGARRTLAFLDEEGDPGHNGGVAVLSGGTFVSVYSEADSNAPRPQASVFNSSIVTSTVGISSDVSVYDIRVAALANGDWVTVWDMDSETLAHSDIRYRVYAPDGTPRSAIRAAATGAADQIDPDVVALPDGDFVIAWDDQSFGIQAQRFNPDGTRDGAQFTVFDGPGATPDAGVTSDGRLIFAWDSEVANTIGASIWDPRSRQIAGFSYQTDARNFVNSTVITAGRDDTLVFGSLEAITMLGQGGDDTLTGLSGSERILGRGGDDAIQGGAGADNIEGGEGNDTIEGGQGSDTLNGGAGRDIVTYRNSPAAVSVTINGDINANNGGDAVADELFAFEILVGSSFGDTLRTPGGQSSTGYTLYGGAGNDTLVGGGSSTTGGGADTLYGEAGADTISGGIGADQISGGADDDILNGNAGNDEIRGGTGNDTLSGGASGFGIFGAGGNDLLFGEAGTDTLNGDVGNDVLDGGADGDVLNGGSGSDWADYASARGRVIADLATPAGNTGDATGDSYSSIENLRGTALNDQLRGDDLANRIEGMLGADVLTGRGGADTLAGGAGRDRLIGGTGADDFFLASGATVDADTIVDFAANEDRIALDGTVFGLPPGALAPERFVLNTLARDGDDRILYNDTTGRLYFDADGNGALAHTLIATLTGAPAIDAGDFIVIGGTAQPALPDEAGFDRAMAMFERPIYAPVTISGFHMMDLHIV